MKKLHTLIGTALIFGASSASAGGVVELNNVDLDRVTAGVLSADALAGAFGIVDGSNPQLNLATTIESEVQAGIGSGFGSSNAESASEGLTEETGAESTSTGTGEFNATSSDDGVIDGTTLSETDANVAIAPDSALASNSASNDLNVSITGVDSDNFGSGLVEGLSISQGSASVDFTSALP